MAVLNFFSEYYGWYILIGCFNLMAVWGNTEPYSIDKTNFIQVLVREFFLWPLALFSIIYQLRTIVYSASTASEYPHPHKGRMLELAALWNGQGADFRKKALLEKNPEKEYMYISKACIFETCAKAIIEETE